MKKNNFALLLIPFTCILVKSQEVAFDYDEAGNQIYRGLLGSKNRSTEDKPLEKTVIALSKSIANKIRVAPVPVKSDLNVFWYKDVANYIKKIDLLPYNSFNIIETVGVSNLNTNSYIFKMSHLTYGVYYLRFYLSDNSIYTVTVTKN